MTRQKTPGSPAVQGAPRSRQGMVLYWPGDRGYARSHERATHIAIAHRLAALKGFGGAEQLDTARRYDGPIYVLPSDTLIGVEQAAALGIHGEHDLFGGVVPFPFVATKAVSHPLVGPDASAPAGWSAEMGRRVREVVLPGFTVFSRDDARHAARCLLERGPVRVKPVQETGGRGQAVVGDEAGLTAVLDAIAPADLLRCGLVLEENLSDAATLSVGQVRVADLVASYYGTQRLTVDNAGETVYGGSDLTVWRGDFDTVLGLALPDAARLAVEQACAYDAAATACFPGFFASRRNYDIVQGLDSRGLRRSGVLEQSWRVGGASGAEVAALEAFRRDPALMTVRAMCVEAFGEGVEPPRDAAVHFRGLDERVGFITKYTRVERVDVG